MTAHWTLIRNAVLVELASEVLHLVDTSLEHIKLGILVKTYSKSVKVATVKTTIGQETFKGYAEQLSTLIPVLIVGSDETTHINETVLLGTHSHCIYIAVHLACNLLNSLVSIAFLAGLDEVRVLGKACAIHNYGNTVLVAKFTSLLDVLHRNGLTANGVVGNGEHHERNITLILNENFLQLLERNVTLERYLKLCVLGLVDCNVDSLSLAGFDVTLSSIEVGVARNNVAFLNEIREENILGSTSLVSWNYILETKDALYHFLELIERGCTCITLVTKHHSRPLLVAHGACTRVSKTVDIDLIGL